MHGASVRMFEVMEETLSVVPFTIKGLSERLRIDLPEEAIGGGVAASGALPSVFKLIRAEVIVVDDSWAHAKVSFDPDESIPVDATTVESRWGPPQSTGTNPTMRQFLIHAWIKGDRSVLAYATKGDGRVAKFVVAVHDVALPQRSEVH